jgi:Na+/H+-dicarboxylate symporter
MLFTLRENRSENFKELPLMSFKLIDLIMLSAPYGVFALLAALVVEAPSLELFKALALYAITLLFCSLYYYSACFFSPFLCRSFGRIQMLIFSPTLFIFS